MKSITPRCCNSLDMNRLVTFYSRLSNVILNVRWLLRLCGVNTHRISASVFRKKNVRSTEYNYIFEKRRLELTGAVSRLLLVILDSGARIRRSSVVWPSGFLDRNSGLRLATKDRTYNSDLNYFNPNLKLFFLVASPCSWIFLSCSKYSRAHSSYHGIVFLLL